MRVCITGHRFFSHPKEEKQRLFDSLELLLTFLPKELTVLSGCAYGVDTHFGEFARLNGIDLHLYFPFNRIIQIVRSPKKYDLRFTKELNKQYKIAKKIVYVNKTFYFFGYQKRNIELVKNSDLLLTYYTIQRSGSGNCYRYALSRGLPTLNLRLNKHDLEKVILQLKI